MSSDSSDEENIDLLREAQDYQFINDSMFSDKKEARPVFDDKLSLPSLRKSKDEDEQYNFFRVTPEFRKYVAKQLSSILDDQLKYKKKSAGISNVDKPAPGGVKLLSNSENYLETEHCFLNQRNPNHTTVIRKPNLVTKRKAEVSEDNLREVALSGETILSKIETKHWSNRNKAPVFEYRQLKNGQLVLKEPVL